jgi:glycerophosphoryl diester phosphodiesterase
LKKIVYIDLNDYADIRYLKEFDRKNILKGLNLIEINEVKLARQVAGYLKFKDHYDIFIVSSNKRVIQEIYSIYPYTRLIYEPKRSFNDIDKFAKELFFAHTFTVCLDISYAHQNVIREFHLRGLKVIIRVNNQVELYQAVLAGSDGVLGENLDPVEIDSDFTSLPIIVAHRGVHDDQVENSLKAAIKAYSAGADYIEMDVHMTQDKVIVVNHDESLGRTYDKNLHIKRNTLKELKQAKQVLEGETLTDSIETLNEYHKQLPKDIGFLIETKVDNKRAIKRLGRVVNSMNRPIMVMSFYPFALIHMNQYIKPYMNGFLVDFKDQRMNFEVLLKVAHKYRLFVHPYYKHNKPEYEIELKRRMVGYSPWGYQKVDAFKALKKGHDMINSDYASLMGHLPKKLITETVLFYQINTSLIIGLKDELENKLSFDSRILFNNPLGLIIEDGKIIAANETGEAYIYLTHQETVEGVNITYATDLIKIIVDDIHNFKGV